MLVVYLKLTPMKAINDITIDYWGPDNYVVKVLDNNLIKVQSSIDRLIIKNAANNIQISVYARD